MKVLLVGNEQANAKTKVLLEGSPGDWTIMTWSGETTAINDGSGKTLTVDGADDRIPEVAHATEIARLASSAKVDLVILTSEDAVQSGIANVLSVYKIPCFGPTRVAAHFVWDPEYLVSFAQRHNVQMTAESVHYSAEEAMRSALKCISAHKRTAIRTRDAQGRTQRFVCTSRDEVKQAIARISVQQGDLGIVQYLIERDSYGTPIQYACLANGTRMFHLGAFGTASREALAFASKNVAQPFVEGLASEDTPYTGWLVFDLMQTEKGLLLRDVRPFPNMDLVSAMAGNATRDWLALISFVMGGLSQVSEFPRRIQA